MPLCHTVQVICSFIIHFNIDYWTAFFISALWAVGKSNILPIVYLLLFHSQANDCNTAIEAHSPQWQCPTKENRHSALTLRLQERQQHTSDQKVRDYDLHLDRE